VVVQGHQGSQVYRTGGEFLLQVQDQGQAQRVLLQQESGRDSGEKTQHVTNQLNTMVGDL
jgi:hypothetical protein